MQVIKRDGHSEEVSFDKILTRLKNLCELFKPLKHVDYTMITKNVINGIYSGVTTSELDELAANIAYPLSYENPEYDTLASRTVINSYHKNNLIYLYEHFKYCLENGLSSFDEKEVKGIQNEGVKYIEKRMFYYVCKALYENVDENGQRSPLIAPYVFEAVKENEDFFESNLCYVRDYDYKYMGFEMLKSSYLLKCSIYIKGTDKRARVVLERPQHMIMRVAIGIHFAPVHVNYDKIRTNNVAIWDAMADDLKKVLHTDSYQRFCKQAHKNKIDWKQLQTFVFNHRNRYNKEQVDIFNKKIDVEFEKNTITWDALLERYSGTTDLANHLRDAIETYTYMSSSKFTHATPTLFNAGTLKPQNSSCYLVMMGYDSLQNGGITKFWADVAEISKWAGGVGSNMHNIRPFGAYIKGTNGHSNGMKPLLKVVNEISVYIDQGGGKRAGSHAVYVEPWVGDIMAILSLKKNRGNERDRARNLFYAMWLPDEFMRRLIYESEHKTEKTWYLMDLNICPGLSDLYDSTLCTSWLSDEEVEARKDEFEFTYTYRRYIREGKYKEAISAVELWEEICNVIIETGVPYIMFKDSCNRKSNQNNLGVIKSSNLCTEIVQYSSPDEIAVCNLASICLNKFIKKTEKIEPIDTRPRYWETSIKVLLGRKDGESLISTFDWEDFENTIRIVVRNLNKIINSNYYPLPETKRSNMRHRPIGIGVQGFADMLSMLRLPFESADAEKLNFYIFETMYYVALDESNRLAEEFGPYETFAGSLASEGILQFDIWEREQKNEGRVAIKYQLSQDWDNLKKRIITSGLHNSLMIAPMPTASTSGIMGNSPCFEPHNSMFYKIRNKNGEFTMANTYLINDLLELGIWTPGIRSKLEENKRGSIFELVNIPQLVRQIYKTASDIGIRNQIDMALTREVFIDQSESFNWFVENPTIRVLTQAHTYGWKRGRKTSSYYTRRLAPVDAKKIQIEKEEKEDCGSKGFCGS
jgi:ribonucleoside-diphosphate reductase alpha subunit